MSVHKRVRSAASARQRDALRLAAAALLIALVQGCTAITASPVSGPDPSDPNARVRPVSYRSAIAGYASQRPVEPRSWREQNERVAPAPKP
jgi:hypothetical protein